MAHMFRKSLLLLLVAMAVHYAGISAQPPCSWQQQQQALVEFYQGWNGPSWNNHSNWLNTSFACSETSPLTLASINLPSYCCWHGVSCCTNSTCPDANNGQDPKCNCTDGTVTSINLHNQNISGPFPTVLYGLSCSLRSLQLQFNSIQGTFPSDITQLSQLQMLGLGTNSISGTIPKELGDLPQLSLLDLQLNQLTGTVPPELCGPDSELTDVILASNRLVGAVSLTGCPSLVYLDVQNNSFTGPLPDVRGSSRLHILRLALNQFTDELNPYMSTLPGPVSVFDVIGNNISGTLPPDIDRLPLMTYISIGQNHLDGTIPPELFTIGPLSLVNLWNNNLTGTIPPEIGLARALGSINLAINSLTGTIPDEMSIFTRGITEVDLRVTFLSCCGTDWDPVELTYKNMSCDRPKLPSWIKQLKEVMLPQQPDVYKGYVITNVGVRCPALTDENQTIILQNWQIDAEYYMYENCSCIDGYHAEYFRVTNATHAEVVNNANPSCLDFGVRLRCVQNSPSQALKQWAVGMVLSLLFLLAMLWCTWYSCYRRRSRLAVMQFFENIRKRVKGEPVGGKVTVVNTDIEGYSELMKQSPELMTTALKLHNHTIGKARWTNFGYTVEQEGDSYTLVFYEAMDAVAFCLQTQLLLLRQPWPEGLCQEAKPAPPPVKTASRHQLLSSIAKGISQPLFRKAGRQSAQAKSAELNGSIGPALSNSTAVTDNAMDSPAQTTDTHLGPGPSDMHAKHSASSLGEPLAIMNAASFVSSGQSIGAVSNASGSMTPPLTAIHSQQKMVTSPLSADGARRASNAELDSGHLSGQILDASCMPARTSQSAILSAELNALTVQSAIKAEGIEHTTQALSSNASVLTAVAERASGGEARRSFNKKLLFHGPRVRMGIATGHLPQGSSARGSVVMERAKTVADAGAGGQVLLDAATFAAIKDRLEELGAVDHNGINNRKLNALRPPWYNWWKQRTQKTDAIALDMGKYMLYNPQGGTNMDIPHYPSVLADLGPPSVTMGTNQTAPPSPHKAAVAASGVPSVPDILHLYQVLPPALVGRAKVFGNKLALKDEWMPIDQPYFAAPGTTEAPLGPTPLLSAPLLPEVTMAFCIVENGKKLPKDAMHRKVHWTLSACIADTLRHVGGGYLCRVQEGDLKYMLAFSSAEAALRWALLLQSVLLYADWPASILKLDKFREERDALGQLLFRGPRLKVGLCTGSPKSILPDHLGRADYHGASVNQAARYMDAAAHGGMVVCEEAIACGILQSWTASHSSAADTKSAQSSSLPTTHSTLTATADPTLPTPHDAPSASSMYATADPCGIRPAGSVYATADGHGVCPSGSVHATAAPLADSHNARPNDPVANAPHDLSSRSLPPTIPHHAAVPHNALAQNNSPQSSTNTINVSVQQSVTKASMQVHPTPPQHTSATSLYINAWQTSQESIPHPNHRSIADEQLDATTESTTAKQAQPTEPVSSASTPSHSTAADQQLLGEQFASGSLEPLLQQAAAIHESSPRFGPSSVYNTVAVDRSNHTKPATMSRLSNTRPLPEQPPLPQQLIPAVLPQSTKLTAANVAPPSTPPAIPEASPFALPSAPSLQNMVVPVSAHRIGLYKFKGNPDAIAMVHVALGPLASRSFPADPPKGKGSRVGLSSGIAAQAHVCLPDLGALYRARFEQAQQATMQQQLANGIKGSGLQYLVGRSRSLFMANPRGAEPRLDLQIAASGELKGVEMSSRSWFGVSRMAAGYHRRSLQQPTPEYNL